MRGPGGGEDVQCAAHHVAGLPVGLRVRPLGQGAVEEVYTLHQTQGLRSQHCVSTGEVERGWCVDVA